MWLFRSGQDEIDPEVGQAYIGGDLQSRFAQRLGYVVAMTVWHGFSKGLLLRVVRTLLGGENEISFEVLETLGPASLRLELRRCERAEDNHLFFGACYSHVEAPLTAPSVERPEIQRNITVLIGRECDGEKDGISFIALNILKVLDKYASIGVQRCRDSLIIKVAQTSFDKISLLCIECDNAERKRRAICLLETLSNLIDDRLCFSGVGSEKTSRLPLRNRADELPVNVTQTNSESVHSGIFFDTAWTWEGRESTPVIGPIGECDKVFTLAAVVPREQKAWNMGGHTFAEYGFLVHRLIVGILIAG